MADDRLHDKSEPRLQSGRLYSMLDLVGAEISCDECGAWQRLPSLDAMGAREAAHERGWRRVGARDLCRNCIQKDKGQE